MLDHGASIGTGYAAYLGLWYMRDWFNWLFFGLWYHLGLPESLAMIHETFKEYATCCCHLLLLPGFFMFPSVCYGTGRPSVQGSPLGALIASFLDVEAVFVVQLFVLRS